MRIVVISLGGHLISYDGKINVAFIKKFSRLIRSLPYRFVIIVGGGSIARKYRDVGRVFVDNKNVLDEIGIAATRLNAILIHAVLSDIAEKKIVTDYSKPVIFRKKVLIGAGWKSGFSTDFDAVYIAKKLNTNTIINMTDVDYVYDKDPKVYKDAKAIKKMTWDEYERLFPKVWAPGISAPFDPIAARLAAKAGSRVLIVNGNNLKNVKGVVEGTSFKGTTIA